MAAPPAAAGKMVINLDDEEDEFDLPPPPKPPAAAAASSPGAPKRVIDLDDDDEEGLPPPPVKVPPAVTTDEDDFDLPPPPKQTTTSGGLDAPPLSSGPSAAHRGRSTAIVPADANDATSSAADPAAQRRTASPQKAPKPKASSSRRNAQDAFKEGFLFKQSPTWPYASQKRWGVLKGRVLAYFDAQGNTTPSGTLELKGAELVDVTKSAKMPHSFGLTGQSGPMKGRIFVFAATSREECQSWTDTLQSVMAEPKTSDLHWFEKMPQALF